MYKNVIKLMSALFVGLCLVTSCGGGDDDKGGSSNSSDNRGKATVKISNAILAATEAGVEIGEIDTTTNIDQAGVQTEAAKIFKAKKVADMIEEVVKALGGDESKIKKKELEDLKESVTKYAVSGTTTAAAEQKAAVDLAAKVVKELSGLIDKLNKE